MMRSRFTWLPILAFALLLEACASRPINPPITQAEPTGGYRFQTRQRHFKDSENLVILAFSGGGTRAAAFSYGVLEFLRRTEIIGPKGGKIRLLDEVDVITGVSGGSFTALAYGLYGERLFDDYEQRFLKRDVQGELVARLLNPAYWGALWSPGWGRSELAAQLYDEILFNGATFADLDRGSGPFIIATATDISTGARLPFVQNGFDILCSDLGAVPLSRAAAASSAVPVVLSPVTINNYGGTCNFAIPHWLQPFADSAKTARPAARALRNLQEVLSYGNGAHRPYIHLVDGGVSDNLGMRGVLDALEALEALHSVHQPTPLDRVRRIIVIVVNSLSSPKTNWDQSESPPGTLDILLRATGVPIDHYSYEAIELLKDTAARWQTMRRLRAAAVFAGNKDPGVADALNVPEVDLYAINVSFPALTDKAELEYLNEQPTTFVLPGEAVDRLRAAAGTIILSSPEFNRLLKDVGATMFPKPPAAGSAAPAASGAATPSPAAE
jgi:NTE family protein